MPDPEDFPILYSTNTWIAYTIAQKFYSAVHYMWCTPHYDPRRRGLDSAVPPTSSPCEMYWALYQETRRGERHSSKIKENKVGLIRGANAKHAEGAISAQKREQIVAIIELAQLSDFRPLLCIMPTLSVLHLLRDPPPEDKAHPLSAEYVIDKLPRAAFDVIELGVHQ